MSNSIPSLTDFESLMNAAKSESALMSNESSAQVIDSTEESAQSKAGPEVNVNQLPSIPSMNQNSTESGNKVELNNTSISAMLNRISSNPEELTKVMQESMGNVTPDMMEQAQKLAMGGQGKQIIDEMQRRGIDPHAMRAQLLEQQRNLRGLGGKSDNTKRAIFITTSRQVKTRNIPSGSASSVASSIFKSQPVELSCSRLASGPLTGKTIKVWCNPNLPGKNKRLSKIIGFPIGGEGLIVMEEGDLLEKDFLVAEKLLV